MKLKIHTQYFIYQIILLKEYTYVNTVHHSHINVQNRSLVTWTFQKLPVQYTVLNYGSLLAQLKFSMIFLLMFNCTELTKPSQFKILNN